MVVKIQLGVLWTVIPCSDAVESCFGGPCYLHPLGEVNDTGEIRMNTGTKHRKGNILVANRI